MGFGRATPAATLGRPLDFVVSLRLEPGEVLNSECIAAEVVAGDSALPRFMVSVVLEAEAGASQIRVRTQTAIDEPVVAVTVTAGCDAKVSRRFTLFADPPVVGMRADAAAVPPLVTGLPAAPPAQLPPPPAAPAPEPARPAVAPIAAAASAPPRRAPAPPAEPAGTALARRAAPPSRPAAAAGPERPRLKLDAATITAVTPAAAAEREAAVRAAEAAASAAQAAASAATARLAAMEKELAALRKEAQTQRQTMERLTRVLAETEEQGRWVPLLLAALLGLAVVVVWLAWRLKKAQDVRDSAWWSQQAAPAIEPSTAREKAATATEELPDTAPAALSGRAEAGTEPAAAAGEAAAAAPGVVRQPRGMTAPAAAAEAPTRDVSIEELLDLEQQAEFFVVLGEDEAAIDLLVTHLRSTGGTVPLPYLKLMEIYRRRGDQASYDRTRDRFNQRFNAMAPEWGADLNAGRTLEDYPVVMAHIERVWGRPVDAMAILETLLFRTDTATVFDLPAYREVLFLYTLARDLHERSAQKAAHVDVLLPLADGSPYFSTTPRPHLGERKATRPVEVDIPVEPRPTAPVDLEVHPLDDATSTNQFGFFDVTSPAPPDAKREK